MCLLSFSCGGRHDCIADDSEIQLKYASLLKISEGNGYTHVTVKNPWDTTKILHSYVLVPDSLPLQECYPEGTLIRTPVKRALVFSSVHSSLLDEFGAIDAVAGVCDTKYMHNTELSSKLKEGKIADCGGSMSPDMEKIIALSPDALFLSPYQDPAPYAKLTELGIPTVECADYMETNPLGRAEWILFYAALVNKTDYGKEIFAKVEKEYTRLKKIASNVKERPLILTELKQGDTWFLPAQSSTTAIFIKDAGGKLPDIVDGEGGSIPFTPEKVLMSASDADFWIIKYYSDKDITYKWIGDESSLYRNFKPFNERMIFACNTSDKLFYEEVPFHPHWLLADMISVFHPELGVKPYSGKDYFSNPSEQ